MAASPNLIAGTATLAVNGITYLLAGGFTYDPGDVKRETKSGQDKVHGFSEMPKAPHVKCKLRDAATLTVKDFNAMRSVSLSCQLANGKVIAGRSLWTVDAQEVETEEGVFEVTFEGLTGSITEQ